MQVVYVKNFNGTEGNKLQNVLLKNIDGRSIAQRNLNHCTGLYLQGKKSFKDYYKECFDLSQLVIITWCFCRN